MRKNTSASELNGKTHKCWRCGKVGKAWLTSLGVMKCKSCISKTKDRIIND